MQHSVYDLKSFYGCQKGRIVQPLLQQRIDALWPDVSDLRVLGIGYAVPYLSGFIDRMAARVAAIMPSALGVHGWMPQQDKNLAALADMEELPFETESIDRILVVHGLEHAVSNAASVGELWRVLKSTGRIMIIVPNRRGLWARAEWSPFGHGVPYSGSQLVRLLRDNLFVIQHVERALFIPPLRSSFLMRSFLPLEKILRRVVPGLGGVVIIEASKQIYSGLPATQSARQRLEGKRMLIPQAVSREGRS